MIRPSFEDLTPSQQAMFGNGVGPAWFPDWFRAWVTGAASWFFDSASWRHHDFGYFIGHSEKHRRLYDRKFRTAMLSDAASAVWWARYFAKFVAHVFYVSVRVFGWKSFHYAKEYRRVK